jgi:hypothetical protein
MYNDLHYKLALIDIAPSDKINKYVSYEPGKRILIEDLNKKEELNINIICNDHIKCIPSSNYYLYFYLISFILILTIFYLIRKITYGNYKIKKFNKKIVKNIKK